MLVRLLALAVGLVAAAGPLVAAAQTDSSFETPVAQTDGSSLVCVTRLLRTMAAEVSVAQVQCQVNGAPASDTDFVVRATRLPDDQAGLSELLVDPLCSGSLVDGSGSCAGMVSDHASPTIGHLIFDGASQPSGLGLMAPETPPTSQPTPAPAQYVPLPEP